MCYWLLTHDQLEASQKLMLPNPKARQQLKIVASKTETEKAIHACRAAAWFRINGVGVVSTGEIKVEQALKLCQKAEKLAPNNAKTWGYLARVLAATKSYSKSPHLCPKNQPTLEASKE